MRILLVSEGGHELNPDGETSALMEMVRRLLPPETEFERRKVSDKVVQQTPVRGKSLSHQKRLMMWLRWAEKSEYDAVIIVIDEDGKTDRRTAVAELHNSQVATIPRALGLAIRMFDAWMLADEQALTTALDHSVSRQKNPETIKQPKDVLQALLEESPCEMSRPDAYLQIVRHCDLDRLTERCPSGFAPFRQAVEQLAPES